MSKSQQKTTINKARNKRRYLRRKGKTPKVPEPLVHEKKPGRRVARN